MGTAEHKINMDLRWHLHLTFKQLVPFIQTQALAAHSRSYTQAMLCSRD